MKVLYINTDFQCFSKVNTDVNTFDCTIFEAIGSETTGIDFTISANRFLRNMVRAIVEHCKCWITKSHWKIFRLL
jgi:tRNA pseudouridine38-40 synthase